MTTDVQTIRREIDAGGEDYIKAQLTGMNTDGLLYIAEAAKFAEVTEAAAFEAEGVPKADRPRFSIDNYLEPLRAAAAQISAGEAEPIPINPAGLIAILEYYRGKYGTHEGWKKFMDAVKVAHLAKKFRGELSASSPAPSAGRSGCLLVVVICAACTVWSAF